MKQGMRAAIAAVVFCVAGFASAEPTDIAVAFSPHGGGEALVLQTTRNARQSIRLMAYSFTAAPVARALLDAKRRGVDVAVTVDFRSNIEEDRSGKARAALGALMDAGVPVRVVDAFPLQHSKYLIVDQSVVETGSYNFSQQAALFSSENVVIISGRRDLASVYLANWRQVSALGRLYQAQ